VCSVCDSETQFSMTESVTSLTGSFHCRLCLHVLLQHRDVNAVGVYVLIGSVC